MFEWLKKGVLTGIGIGLLTKDKAEEVLKKVVAEAKLSEEEGHKLLQNLRMHSEEARESLKQQVEKQVQSVLEKMSVATREEVEQMRTRIDKLEADLANRGEEGCDS